MPNENSIPARVGGLKAAFERIQQVALDLTTLDVQTWTGELAVVLDKNGTIDWQVVRTGADGKIELAAATRVSLDYDIVNFRAADGAVLTPELLELHNAAVDSAVQGRAALVRLVGEAVLP